MRGCAGELMFVCRVAKNPCIALPLELLEGFEPSTSSLPRTCSTTELQQHYRRRPFERPPPLSTTKPGHKSLLHWRQETIRPGFLPKKWCDSKTGGCPVKDYLHCFRKNRGACGARKPPRRPASRHPKLSFAMRKRSAKLSAAHGKPSHQPPDHPNYRRTPQRLTHRGSPFVLIWLACPWTSRTPHASPLPCFGLSLPPSNLFSPAS